MGAPRHQGEGKGVRLPGRGRGDLSLSAKLPSSAGVALRLPFASPTEYGLGRSGWVTARFPRAGRLPLEVLRLWIDESYRAIAPKRLVAQLQPDQSPVRARRAPASGTGRTKRRLRPST